MMSRFESPVYALALLVVVFLLSESGRIYVIDAEQGSRIKRSHGDEHAHYTSPQQNEKAFLFYISNGLSNNIILRFQNKTEGVDPLRIKRSSRKGTQEMQSSRLSGGKNTKLGVSSASDFRRIRHALKKLKGVSVDGESSETFPLQKQRQETHEQKEEPPDFQFPFETRAKSSPASSQSILPTKISDSTITNLGLYFKEKSLVNSELEEANGRGVKQSRISFRKQVKEKTLESNESSGESQITRAVVQVDVCYGTDDVLIVIGITCSLNFAFVFLIHACVRWFSNSKEKELNCKDALDGSGDESLDDEEEFWQSTGGNGRASTRSLYVLKNEKSKNYIQRSYSYSMEELRFTNIP